MQKIVVKEVRGPLGKGEKKFYAVVDEKGAEFTTFDTKIAQVTQGSVLEIEPKVDGKYVNITEWKVLEEGKASPSFQGNGKLAYGKTSEQFDSERRSIESQTAFNGIIKLIEQEAVLKVDFVPGDVKELAYEWARVRLKGTVPSVPVKNAEPAKQPEALDETAKGFQNAGQFLTKCKEVFGLNRSQVLEHSEITALFDAGDFNKAYLKLAELTAKK